MKLMVLANSINVELMSQDVSDDIMFATEWERDVVLDWIYEEQCVKMSMAQAETLLDWLREEIEYGNAIYAERVMIKAREIVGGE
jgi:hypothetical protein